MYVQGLEVVGTLPRELDGIFIRNGPNPQFPPEGPGPGNYHWYVLTFTLFLFDFTTHAPSLERKKCDCVAYIL